MHFIYKIGRIAKDVKHLITHMLTVIKTAGRNGQKTIIVVSLEVKFMFGTLAR